GADYCLVDNTDGSPDEFVSTNYAPNGVSFCVSTSIDGRQGSSGGVVLTQPYGPSGKQASTPFGVAVFEGASMPDWLPHTTTMSGEDVPDSLVVNTIHAVPFRESPP